MIPSFKASLKEFSNNSKEPEAKSVKRSIKEIRRKNELKNYRKLHKDFRDRKDATVIHTSIGYTW